MSWNDVHGYPVGCWKCTEVPQQIKNEMLKNDLKQVKSAFETEPPKPASEPTPTPKPEPESKASSAAALKKSKIAVVASSAALKNSNLTNKIEKDNGKTTMTTQTSTTATPAVQTLLSITSDRNVSFLANVMNAAKAGTELGAAGAASGSATDFVVKRVGKTWPVAGAFIAGTPLVRPALDFIVPLGVGIITWHKMVPGVTPERQEKIANWCLVAISSHVDTIMSKVGRDFFSSLFKHMENAVDEWNVNPLGN
jgi:hypothetical protein